MNGGEARNGMVEQKFVSVMYSGPFPTCNLGPSCIALLRPSTFMHEPLTLDPGLLNVG